MIKDRVIVVWSEEPSSLVTAITTLLTSTGARAKDAVAAIKTPSAAPAWQEYLADIQQAEGRIDGIVVVSAPKPNPAPITSLTLRDFSHRLRGVTLSAWVAQQQGVLAFRNQEAGGAIVHVTSASPSTGYAGDSPLASASAGVLMAAKAAALECGKAGDGTVVNSVIAAGHSDSDVNDVAEAVAFLIGDGNGYMTGTELRVGADLV